jgi:hypothetical protein
MDQTATTLICAAPPMSWWDVATKSAQLLLAAIAVSPFISKALRLVRTMPPMTQDERKEHIMLGVGDRMGWFEKCCRAVLEWARKKPKDLLSWRERRYRLLWCPLGGHHGEIEGSGSTRFAMQCRDCRDWGYGETEEDVRRWAARGKESYAATVFRERVDPNTELINQLGEKMAEAMGNVTSVHR